MRSSYSEKDVVLLLKDITGKVQPQSTQEREKLIQSGRHYCEMLPVEYVPTKEYMRVYREALSEYSGPVAQAVSRLCDKIISEKGEKVVLVSLARAGTPVGILLKRYIALKYGWDVPHYSISIIRGRGLDNNAMKYLLQRYDASRLLFVDGWIGKGAIWRELKKAVSVYDGVSSDIAVLSDPANITEFCGTHDDILIPSSCLNSTVSGLISRTFLREDIIGEGDFHGALYYEELKNSDLSYDFIHEIEKHFELHPAVLEERMEGTGMEEVENISEHFKIEDINLIKPGIGETTRVLLRRVPWKVLISKEHAGSKEIRHILRLAEEKGVECMPYPMKHYKCCGIIKKLSDI